MSPEDINRFITKSINVFVYLHYQNKFPTKILGENAAFMGKTSDQNTSYNFGGPFLPFNFFIELY